MQSNGVLCASCANQHRAYFFSLYLSALLKIHLISIKAFVRMNWDFIYFSVCFKLCKIISIDWDTKLNCNHFVCRIAVFDRTIICIYKYTYIDKAKIECIYVCAMHTVHIMLQISNRRWYQMSCLSQIKHLNLLDGLRRAQSNNFK